MPKKAPRPDRGNAPEGILEPPEPVAVDVPLEVAPEPLAPGVYSGVWPNLVMTAYVDENGVTVQVAPEVTEPVVADVPLVPDPTPSPETPVTP